MLFSIDEATMVVGTGENNIDRTCSLLLSLLWCNYTFIRFVNNFGRSFPEKKKNKIKNNFIPADNPENEEMKQFR